MKTDNLPLWLALGALLAVTMLAAAAVLYPLLTVVGVAAVMLGFSALLAPRLLLVAGIPVTLLLDPIASGVLGLALVAMIAVAWVAGLLVGRWRLHLPLHGGLAALAGWMVCSYLLFPQDLPSVLSRGHDLLTLLVGVLACAVAGSIQPPVRQVVATTAMTAVVGGIVALRVGPTPIDRASALGLNFNFFAVVLAIGVVALLARYLATKNPLWLAGAIPSLLGLSATRSRGGFISLAAGLTVLLFVGRRRRTQVFVFLLITLLMFVALVVPPLASELRGAVVGRRTDAELNSYTQFRRQAAELAVGYILEHPLTGIGYGLFPSAAERDPRLGLYINTHNEYLRLAAETGLIGLVLFLLLVVPVVRRTGLDHSAQASLVTYLTSLLFANTLSNVSVTMPFWLLLGLVWGRSEEQSLLISSGTERIGRADGESLPNLPMRVF